MEISTGASISLISHDTFTKLWSTSQRPTLRPSTQKLRTYTGEQLEVLGYITVHVTYGKQHQMLPLLVVAGSGPSLFGLQNIRFEAIHNL